MTAMLAISGMPLESLAGLFALDPLVVIAVVARMTAVVAAGGLGCFPWLGPRIGAAAVLALTAAALPTAAAVPWEPQQPVIAIAGEAVVGLGLGLAMAVAFAAASWAGGLLASVSGMAWADDFAGDGGSGEGAAARLAGWLAVGGFLAAGGHVVLIGGLIESLDRLPLGSLASAIDRDRFAETVVALPTAALSLAFAVALPALIAVLTFHLAAALCLRSVRFVAGPGMLQAAASIVLVAAVVAGAGGWTEGFAAAVRPLIERGLLAGF